MKGKVKYFYSYKKFLKFIEEMKFGKDEVVITGGIDDNLQDYIKVEW